MNRVVHFKITLLGSKPSIWRQFHIPEDYRFDRFHQVLQIVMGWENAHLHDFKFSNRKIGMLFDDMWDFEEMEDETKVYLRDVYLEIGSRFQYCYDFGDNWEHELEVEGITEYDESIIPQCTSGAGACPLEDCGGIWGYSDILESLNTPNHPSYEEWSEWLPENFDPKRFSIVEINQELAKFAKWHQRHPRAKSTPWHRL